MSLYESISTASFQLYSGIAARAAAGADVCFSPLPVLMVNGMLAAGSRGTTREQILQVSGCPSRSQEEEWRQTLHQARQDLMGLSGIQCSFATGLWMDHEVRARKTFLETLNGHVQSVDFQNEWETARKTINDWVEKKTEDNIRDLIPAGMIDTLTRLVVSAAFFCDAPWLQPFDPSKTAKEGFLLDDGSRVQRAMMKKEVDESDEGPRLHFCDTGDLQALQLPYASRDLAMTVLKPKDPQDLSNLEWELPNLWKELNHCFGDYELRRIWLPRFDSDPGTADLKPVLQDLGMTDAFLKRAADFTGMTDQYRYLHVTDYAAKARNITTEQGSRMAAGAAAVVSLECIARPAEFVADRPFVWVVSHRNFPVMIGRTADPKDPA